jgi:uracil permease
MKFFPKFTAKNMVLGTQHALAMFGATILIPMLMGLPPSLGLFSAGVGTLLYHLVTKKTIPIFLGSSAAYLATFLMIRDTTSMGTAIGSLAGAGIVYILVGLLVSKIGYKTIQKILPNTVAGGVILVIGITLVPVALMLAQANFMLALISASIMIVYCAIDKGPFRVAPVMLAILTGYVISIFMGIVDFTPVLNAPWFALPAFVTPVFNPSAMGTMAVIGVVAMLEHFGDLTTNSMITGKNHFESPGLHRSLIGAGCSLIFSSILGGTPTTTYGENNGVLAITKQYDPALIRVAAIIAILLSVFGKFGALLSTIPLPVIGGVSFILFSMLAMSGVNTLKTAQVELMEFRHAVSFMVPVFIGVASVLTNNPLQLTIGPITFAGVSLAAIVGISMNLFFELIDKIKNKFKKKSKCLCEDCKNASAMMQELEEQEQLTIDSLNLQNKKGEN